MNGDEKQKKKFGKMYKDHYVEFMMEA